MAKPGPIPKRSSERTRTNQAGEDGITLKKGVALDYYWPEPSEEWPEIVVDFYDSFKESGMQAFYQQTDIAQLRMACQLLSEEWGKPRRSAMIMAEAFKLLQGLGATEGERRQMKIELDKPVVEEVETRQAKVASIKSRLKSPPTE